MRKMQLHEFDRLMIEQGGWTFPAEYYEEFIKPVYLELNEDKVEFVKFCHAKDLNGLKLLKNNLPTVKKLAETGMNVFQIHTAIYLLAEKDHLIRGLTNKIVEQPEPEEPDITVPHLTFRPGDRVRIKHALHRGQTGKIERYFPATDNYLVAIDGLPDRIILRDKDLEVEA